jgi:ComF family protein
MTAARTRVLERLYDTIPRAVRAIARRVADQLFPWFCVGCQVPADGALCSACLSRIRWIGEPWCPQCGLPLASGPSHPCGRCATDPPAFARLRAIACYRPADEERDPLGLALRGLKYGGRRALAPTLSTLLAERFPFERCAHDVAAPVPLHVDRLRTRGFNQALLLARAPARRFGLRIDGGLLTRVRDTPPQVGLAEAERRGNVRQAFTLRPGRSVEGLRVLLVDDVCTSTATARACATVLRERGAASVDVLALARALPH